MRKHATHSIAPQARKRSSPCRLASLIFLGLSAGPDSRLHPRLSHVVHLRRTALERHKKLPDGWGSLLVERYLRERFGIVNPLNILQKLSLVGKSGRGSLEYFPDGSFLSDVNFSDFDEIARHCANLLEEKEISAEDLETIYNAGGSSGGARPKVFARINKKEWLVKFRASADPKNVGTIEYAYSVLAKKCGIEMPDTQLIQGKYFAVERFDLSSAGKIHTITASGFPFFSMNETQNS